MSEKILCVDDDANVLAGYQRQTRGRFTVDTAPGGEQGLEALARKGPYAVIVSDMRMPGMNGAQFLARACQTAPESVRMLLTGYAEQSAAIEAVNEGHIFRFLTKPCPTDVFLKALSDGVAQYRLLRVEKELLEQTLRSSIKVLTEVLALVNPLAFGRATRIQRFVQVLARKFEVADAWQLEVAALLSQLGCVTVPESVLHKVYAGGNLDAKEWAMFEAHPRIGQDLIAKIPRMDDVAEMIAYQEKHFDGTGVPKGGKHGAEIPLGARILKVVLDFDCLATREPARLKILQQMKTRTGWYDAAVLQCLEEIILAAATLVPKNVTVAELDYGMILDAPIMTVKGLLIVSKGQEITPAMRQRLLNYAADGSIREPITILVEAEPSA